MLADIGKESSHFSLKIAYNFNIANPIASNFLKFICGLWVCNGSYAIEMRYRTHIKVACLLSRPLCCAAVRYIAIKHMNNKFYAFRVLFTRFKNVFSISNLEKLAC